MWIRKLYYFLFPGSVDEQEKRYIEENGYPKKSVVFTDSQGRMSQIVGSDTFLKNIELLKKSNIIKRENKNNI